MAAELHQEGLEYLLKTAFSEEIAVPASFYVGLCTDSSPAENAALSDLTELTDSGYSRQTVTSNSTDCVVAAAGTNDQKVTLAEVDFANSSGGDWTAANSVFLATTNDDSGKLIATAPITGAPLTIADGSTYSATIVLQLNG